ncbi:outer membrane protein assembly factor BamC, partial [Escherichia coli]|uniref:outer membrane protein assembly factor BamC n=1 Tax=Escherichia coli TaxID=562 RepID=UPI003D811A2D
MNWVRGPFNVVWQRLPAALEKVGMKVTDSTTTVGHRDCIITGGHRQNHSSRG